MKRYCLLLSAMLLCFLCACSVTEQNERTTMYDIMESGTEEEIAAAAKDAQEKHDELFQLAMDESSAWYAYVDDNSTENFEYDIYSLVRAFYPGSEVKVYLAGEEPEGEYTLLLKVDYRPDQIFLEVWKNCTMFYPPRGKVFRMNTSLSIHTIPTY